MSEEIQAEIESIANFLRGMCFDPALPFEFKDHINKQIQRLGVVADAMLAARGGE